MTRPRAVIGLARRVVIACLGTTVVLLGLVMIVLPAPAVIVIPAGLAILATEFLWARRLLVRIRVHAETLTTRLRRPRS